jgi:hypothetical protein
LRHPHTIPPLPPVLAGRMRATAAR